MMTVSAVLIVYALTLIVSAYKSPTYSNNNSNSIYIITEMHDNLIGLFFLFVTCNCLRS